MTPETNLTVSVDPITAATSAAEDDPLWYKDAIIYQAHVKSFYDGNGDGIGDFIGLTQKLDYLQNLGINCLWLLPFFPSPLKDDGYDISDYRNVHPSYGTLEDFTAFVRAAHERKIKVLIELVVNHTSDQHPWFQRARNAPPGSPEREFYVWSDTDKKFPETRIIFCDTEKSNWTYDPVAQQYYWHRFFSHQPDLNHNNPEVVDAVIDVMKFWLDMGVDALRLDAVPYLCVREGTTNENLPETHEVLKRIRRELDRTYRSRMLLAEANQWPADVRAYFGDGDECHMAFHFPLMPRMFMALRQEDRHAITEILTHTPEIPETSQWALFLRNHDELTLEMVTDEERDYMYQVYAADPQMRLNLGIRRRLAPLVENSRRRVELLHSLLFSMPGTPIIYYGDEIGMGDNIYLGDRNGVRTPMQWSSDRNGGFSRADPARLFAPPIMDPVYGYQALNVEAQERTPFSLLNWMKRLIAMRKQHRVFGRGSLEFVDSPNRKVLAFLRRDDQETILVVVNLARTVQPAELDLRALAGLIPVEMTGLTDFPRVGDRPYFLTLAPYASYWFTLQKTAIQIAQQLPPEPSDPIAALAASLPTLMMGPDWNGLLDTATRSVVERSALAPFIQRQRWYSAKTKRIRQIGFSDWTAIRGGATPAFLTVVSIAFDDGSNETYTLPLALASGDQASRLISEQASAVVARVSGARKGVLFDGLFDDDVCSRLLAMIARGEEVATRRGTVQGEPNRDRVEDPAKLPADLRWTRGSGDQSNSVVFLGDRYVFKLFRRIEPGPNPEYEIGQFLARRGFTRTPPLAGGLLYHRPELEAGTFAVANVVVKHQGSAWEFTIDELRRYYERVLTRASGSPETLPEHTGETPPPFFIALEGWYLSNAATLGSRTAELHEVLASNHEQAFAPEPLAGAGLRLMARDMRNHGAAVLSLLESKLSNLDEAARTQAELILSSRTALLERLARAGEIRDPGQMIRIHGDYHLGQVLRAEEDFIILDFEGEPSRPIAERRGKQSPLKDLAGMVRSFSYAAHATLLTSTVHSPDNYVPLTPWADTWQRWVSEAFVNAYRSALGQATLVPGGDEFDALLQILILDKALYELAYELNNRPDWVRIPLLGIVGLL